MTTKDNIKMLLTIVIAVIASFGVGYLFGLEQGAAFVADALK